VRLTTDLELVPRVIIKGDVPPLPHTSPWGVQGLSEILVFSQRLTRRSSLRFIYIHIAASK
jgi:hypothetical protein